MDLIPQAAEAGFNQSASEIDAVTAEMERLTVILNEADADMGNSAMECREGAK